MKEAQRRIFIVENAPRVRNALCALLAGAGGEGDVVHSTREARERISEASRDRLILDLRYAPTAPDPAAPQVKNLEVSLVGRILVVTGEVSDTTVFRQIEDFGPPHFSLKHMTSSLHAFVRMLFQASRRAFQRG